MSAVVVDLPLVPVMATTRSRSVSWSQRLSADVTRDAVVLQFEDVGTSAGNTRTLQHHVAREECFEAAVVGDEHVVAQSLDVIDDDQLGDVPRSKSAAARPSMP